MGKTALCRVSSQCSSPCPNWTGKKKKQYSTYLSRSLLSRVQAVSLMVSKGQSKVRAFIAQLTSGPLCKAVLDALPLFGILYTLPRAVSDECGDHVGRCRDSGSR